MIICRPFCLCGCSGIVLLAGIIIATEIIINLNKRDDDLDSCAVTK